MRTVRNITVCVSPELYRRTKLLAANYDTTVTDMVAYLLERLPDALARAAYPVGGRKRKPVEPTSATLPRFQISAIERSLGTRAAKALRTAASSMPAAYPAP